MRAISKNTRKVTALTLAAALVVAVYLNWQYARAGVTLEENAVQVAAGADTADEASAPIGVGFPGVSLPGAAGSAAPGPDRADRRGRGHDRDGDTGNRGGDRLCYGHAVGTDPKPGNACAAG